LSCYHIYANFVYLIFLYRTRLPPDTTVFPYTTLFRSDIRVDGTVMWLSGQTLTLALDGQVVPGYYQIVGQYLVVVPGPRPTVNEIEEHTSELQSRFDLVCRLLLEKKKQNLQVAKR